MSASRAPQPGDTRRNKHKSALIAGLCLILGLLPWSEVSSQTQPPPGQKAAAAADQGQILPRANVLAEMLSVYRTQRPDGSLDFRGPLAFFENYPLLATITLDINQRQKDVAVLSQSVSAISRYYGYLFSSKDLDSNLLIETTIPSPGGPDLTNIEEVGYNALLSLDMIALARCYLELRKPLKALYWYEGARAQQEHVVWACFDIESNYFFPRDPATGSRIKNFYALSALPILFLDNVGDNHVASMINNYLLNSNNFFPETPSFYLYGADAAPGRPEYPAADPASLLKTLLLSRILFSAGDESRGDSAVHQALGQIEAGKKYGGWCAACVNYLTHILETGDYRGLYPKTGALDVFKELVKHKRRIDDNLVVRLDHDVEVVKSLLEPGAKLDPTDAGNRLREVFQIVSTTREQLASNQLFDREDSHETGGLEPGLAMANLLNDVTSVLRAAENSLSGLVNQDSGLRVTATLLNERPVTGQRIEMKWTIESRTRPVEIRSAKVLSDQASDDLIEPGTSVVVNPGAPVSLNHSFPARFDRVNTLELIRKTLILEDASGRRTKHNVIRSVYGEQPVQVTARFPRGKILGGEPVPVDVQIVKKIATRVELQGGWYSAAGLKLEEGDAFRYAMAAGEDSVMLRVNVVVPAPCRPGAFPFKFKFVGNGNDIGTITSSFFKPYQWLFIGPFERSQNPMSTQYPPEQSVELQKTYTGIGRNIAWQILPEDANAGSGAVSLRGILSPAGVGYLYTVIESPAKKSCPLFLGANVYASVFVNGSLALIYKPSNTLQMTSTNIQVNQGANTVLVKVLGDQTSRVYFKIGDDENMSPDEFNNNLSELVIGYDDLRERSQQLLAGDGDVQRLVTLRYHDPDAGSVAVIGTFNGWSPEHSHMQKTVEGTWEITLSLQPGKYAYRFLINNRKQVLDPKGAFEEPDGFGGKNSVIFVKK